MLVAVFHCNVNVSCCLVAVDACHVSRGCEDRIAAMLRDAVDACHVSRGCEDRIAAMLRDAVPCNPHERRVVSAQSRREVAR